VAKTLRSHRKGGVGFIDWLDRFVHSHWFSEPQPKKSNYEKRDSDQKSVRSVLCDPEWPKIAVLNYAMDAASGERQNWHATDEPPCAAPSDPNVKLHRSAEGNRNDVNHKRSALGLTRKSSGTAGETER
jgi:hypothetical protein